ncbi:unnamed protein product [Nesidiocoris tenuis]|uniref:Uncharacterized protein n=1 Tax=Nesidiocoris tenuis TaxID=355587 RepID=A0A6H5GHL3_9HEMI|nr:unnamed protein product [Nesidiocoris tenuis]
MRIRSTHFQNRAKVRAPEYSDQAAQQFDELQSNDSLRAHHEACNSKRSNLPIWQMAPFDLA